MIAGRENIKNGEKPEARSYKRGRWCVGSGGLLAKTNKSSLAAADTTTVASFRLPVAMTNFCHPFKQIFLQQTPPFFVLVYFSIFCALSARVSRLAVELWLRLLPKLVVLFCEAKSFPFSWEEK